MADLEDATQQTEQVDPIINANGLNADQQLAYEAYYERKPEYHPDQRVPKDSRHFGVVLEDNPFLVGDAEDDWQEGTVLGQMNLNCEYNNWVPHGCTVSRSNQQKLFHSNPTQNVSIVYHINKANLNKLKSETGHLLGCDLKDIVLNL
jgi:hypothetical protein